MEKITEDLVSFEVAKLAKEKGFTLQTNPFGLDLYLTKFYRPSTKTLLSYGRTGRSKLNTLIYAPTQSLLQRWLREVHNIDITISLVANGYGFYIHKDRNYTNKGENYGISGITYEEALEVGLQEALKLLPNKE